jgi:hypothetical protein
MVLERALSFGLLSILVSSFAAGLSAMASSQLGNSSFGQITNQANNMRMIQFTLRFPF